MATTGVAERHLSLGPANETQRLIIGVTGYAQHNTIGVFPWKAWPYYVPYPSPPLHGLHFRNAYTPANNLVSDFLPSSAVLFDVAPLASNGGLTGGKPAPGFCWEATSPTGTPIPGADSDLGAVFKAYYNYNYKSPTNTTGPTEALAVAYLQAALEYAQRKNLPRDFYAPQSITNPVGDFLPGTLNASGDDYQHVAWKQVQAMRYATSPMRLPA